MENASFEESVKILILIGAVDDDSKVKYILTSIKAGLEKWAKKMDIAPALDECLAVFSEECKIFGQSDALAPHSKLAYTKNNISVLVLFSPTCIMVNNGIAELILSPCAGRLVVYGGHFVDSQPNWFFQDGVFAVEDLEYVLNDQEITSTLQRTNIQSKVTVTCCEAEKWKLSKQYPQVEMEFVDPFLPTDEMNRGSPMKGLKKFVVDLEDTLKEQVEGIFFQLSPPKHRSFLRVQRPSIYIFPGGNGDSAFFKVDGFNVLINGGALTRPWFWHLIRHEYRVDCVLATHLGADCLTGLNSFFLRKVHEMKLKFPKDQDCDEFKYLSKFILSPDLGGVFINAPSQFVEGLKRGCDSSDHPQFLADSTVPQHLNIKTTDMVRDTFRLLRTMQIEPQPLARKNDVQSITLSYKWNVGKLELFVLNPANDGKEIDFIRQKWGLTEKSVEQSTKSGVCVDGGEEGQSLVSDLASICCMLVWFPASPKERIIRVLFPGNTAEGKIFEGLEKLKDVDFLSYSVPTGEFLAKSKASKPTKTTSRVKANITTTKTTSKTTTTTSAASKSAQSSLKENQSSTSKTGVSGIGSKVTAAKRTTKTATTTTKSTQSTVKTSSTMGKPATAPAKSSRTTASKKPLSAPRKLTNEANVTTRSKREGIDLTKPAEKRPKPTQALTSASTATKSKTGPVQARAEARVRTKKLAEKSPPKPTLSKATDAKQTKAPKLSQLTRKPPAAGTSKSRLDKAGASKSPEKKDKAAPKTTTEESPLKILDQALESLTQEEPKSKESSPLLKRPTPEGQDRAEQQFIEVASQVDVNKKLDSEQPPKQVDQNTVSVVEKLPQEVNLNEQIPTPSDYLTVSPKTDKNNEFMLVENESPHPEKAADITKEIPCEFGEPKELNSSPEKIASVSDAEVIDQEPDVLKEQESSVSIVNEEQDDIPIIEDDEPPQEKESELHVKVQTDENFDETCSVNEPPSSDENVERSLIQIQSPLNLSSNEGLNTEEPPSSDENVERSLIQIQSPLNLASNEGLNTEEPPSSDENVERSLTQIQSPLNLASNEGLNTEEAVNIESDLSVENVPEASKDDQEQESSFEDDAEQSSFILDDTKVSDDLDSKILDVLGNDAKSILVNTKDASQHTENKEDENMQEKLSFYDVKDEGQQIQQEKELPTSEDLKDQSSFSPKEVEQAFSLMEEEQPLRHEEGSPIAEDFQTSSLQENISQDQKAPSNAPDTSPFTQYRDTRETNVTLLSQANISKQTMTKESTSSYTYAKDMSLEPLKSEFAQLHIESGVDLSPGAEIGILSEQDFSEEEHSTSSLHEEKRGDLAKPEEQDPVFGSQTYEDENLDNLAKPEEQDPVFGSQTYEDENLDNCSAPAAPSNDENDNLNDCEALTELDNRVDDNHKGPDSMLTYAVSIAPSAAPNDNTPAVESILESCGLQTVQKQEKYLELQNKEQSLESENMSYSPLSSGPSLSADNLQELATPQDTTSQSPGIVEFNNLEIEKKALENSINQPQREDLIDSPSSDNPLEPKSDVQTDLIFDLYPTEIEAGDVTVLNIDADQKNQSAEGCYDNNGNRTEIGLNPTNAETGSRGDVILNWSPTADIREDMSAQAAEGNVSACHRGIVSFCDSEDNLVGKNITNDIIPHHEEKNGDIEPENSLFEKQSPVPEVQGKESGKSAIIDEEEAKHDEQLEDQSPLPLCQDSSSPSLLPPESIFIEKSEESVYHLELEEANYPALKEQSPTDDYISALDREMSAGVSLATIEFDRDLENPHAEQEKESPAMHVCPNKLESDEQDLGSKETFYPDIIGSTLEPAESSQFKEQENVILNESSNLEMNRTDNKNFFEESGYSLSSTNCDDPVPKGDLPSPKLSSEANQDHTTTTEANEWNFAMNNPFLADLTQHESSSDPYPVPVRQQDPSMAPSDRIASAKPKKNTISGGKKEPPCYYFDLAYVPHHGNKNHCGLEFFKRIKSKYYVLSGFDAKNHEPSSEVLNALLEGKKTWSKPADTDDTNVSVIPTHNSSALFDWFEKNHQELSAESIHLVAIGSRVKLLDENIEACKIEL